jgi:hypothetical protein
MHIGRTLAAAAAAALLVAAPASAKYVNGVEGNCRSASAQVTDGAANVRNYGPDAPSGAPLQGDRLRFPKHFYDVEGGAASIRYGSNAYDVKPGTVFKLGCYGPAKGAALRPALDLLVGSVHVTTGAVKPGGVFDEEGLYNPVPGGTQQMGYTVTRTLARQGLQFGDVVKWFADYANQPTGTTRATVDGKDPLNVTPYVGARRGQCRHAHGARLSTRGSYGHGTATYEGLV